MRGVNQIAALLNGVAAITYTKGEATTNVAVHDPLINKKELWQFSILFLPSNTWGLFVTWSHFRSTFFQVFDPRELLLFGGKRHRTMEPA